MEFQDGERTFSCEAKSSPATPGTVWWWMSVTGESQRYAAFRAEPGDTQASLRQRILAYYTQLLVERERPREVRGHWAQRRAQPQAAPAGADQGAAAPNAAPATAPATATAAAEPAKAAKSSKSSKA